MIREVDFRYIVVRNGADFCELHTSGRGEASIRMKGNAEIKTSLRGTFVPDDRIDWLSDRIRAEMILNGMTYPLGVFLPATVKFSEADGIRTVEVEAYDQCWLARDYKQASTVEIASGTVYTTAVQQLLAAAGILLTAVTPSSATLAEDRTWEIGTSYLSIVNELLAEINYKPLWFNAQGLAVIEPKAVPTAENIQHILDGDDVKSLLLPEITRETDIYSAPNVFVVSVANPDKGANMAATAVNDNLLSPLSVSRRGRRIVKQVRLNNIASQAELEKYAETLVIESMYVGETVSVSTGLLPDFGVSDVVALNMSGVFAICLEQGWTMKLQAGGEMQHTLERVVVQYGI